MKPLRPTADVSRLPSVTFGARSLMWWGTLGFMTIEGWTTALLVAAYLYLRQNYQAWPPLRTPDPSLLIPTINLALMVLSTVPATLAARAASRLDTAAVKRWLLVSSLAILPIVVLRWWELWALNVRWDTNAYGSAAWTIVGFHTSLLVLDFCDTVGITGFFWLKRLPVRSFSDVSDNTFYWYFTVGIWIPVYLIVYVGPRIFCDAIDGAAVATSRFTRWPGLLRLALDLLLGPIVALINQEAIYAGDMWACGHNARGSLHIVPALCLVVTITAAVDAYMIWRSVGRGVEEERGSTVETRTRFVAILGVSISVFSSIVIAAQWFGIFMFSACMRA